MKPILMARFSPDDIKKIAPELLDVEQRLHVLNGATDMVMGVLHPGDLDELYKHVNEPAGHVKRAHIADANARLEQGYEECPPDGRWARIAFFLEIPMLLISIPANRPDVFADILDGQFTAPSTGYQTVRKTVLLRTHRNRINIGLEELYVDAWGEARETGAVDIVYICNGSVAVCRHPLPTNLMNAIAMASDGPVLPGASSFGWEGELADADVDTALEPALLEKWTPNIYTSRINSAEIFNRWNDRVRKNYENRTQLGLKFPF